MATKSGSLLHHVKDAVATVPPDPSSKRQKLQHHWSEVEPISPRFSSQDDPYSMKLIEGRGELDGFVFAVTDGQ
jgi:hypothetical protein